MPKSLARKFALSSAVALGLVSFAANVEAATLTFVAALSGSAESPPNASPGTGNVTVIFDDVTQMMTIDTMFSGLLGSTTAAHIHCCLPMPSNNAGVATMLPTFADFPLGVTAGSYNHVFDMSLASSYNPVFVTAQGGIFPALTALLNGMESGNAYFNVHTHLFPGGEIRGNFALAPSAIPIPAALPLLAAGLSAMGFMGWRRKRRAA